MADEASMKYSGPAYQILSISTENFKTELKDLLENILSITAMELILAKDLSHVTQHKIHLCFIKLFMKEKAFKFNLIMFSTKVRSLSNCTTSMIHSILSHKAVFNIPCCPIFSFVLFAFIHQYNHEHVIQPTVQET